MQLYGLNSCDSCRASRKALKKLNVEYVDVRDSGVPKKILKMAFAQFGSALINSLTLRRAISPPPTTVTGFFLRFINIGKLSIIKCYSIQLFIYSSS